MDVKRVQHIFLLAPVLLVLHLVEQWFFGLLIVFEGLLEKFAMLQGILGGVDRGIAFLVGVFGFLWLGTTYLLLVGGKWQRVVVLFFGLIFASEIHHISSAIAARAYYPGMITGLLFFLFGVALLKEAL